MRNLLIFTSSSISFVLSCKSLSTLDWRLESAALLEWPFKRLMFQQQTNNDTIKSKYTKFLCNLDNWFQAWNEEELKNSWLFLKFHFDVIKICSYDQEFQFIPALDSSTVDLLLVLMSYQHQRFHRHLYHQQRFPQEDVDLMTDLLHFLYQSNSPFLLLKEQRKETIKLFLADYAR